MMKLLILLFSMVALPTTNVRKISSLRHLDEYILTLVKQQTQRPPCPLGPDATQEELKYVVFFSPDTSLSNSLFESSTEMQDIHCCMKGNFINHR